MGPGPGHTTIQRHGQTTMHCPLPSAAILRCETTSLKMEAAPFWPQDDLRMLECQEMKLRLWIYVVSDYGLGLAHISTGSGWRGGKYWLVSPRAGWELGPFMARTSMERNVAVRAVFGEKLLELWAAVIKQQWKRCQRARVNKSLCKHYNIMFPCFAWFEGFYAVCLLFLFRMKYVAREHEY